MKKYLPHVFTMILLIAAAPAFAVPPPVGAKKPDGMTCHVNRIEIDRRVKAYKAASARGVPAFKALGSLPSPIAPKVIVVRVDFSDKFMVKSKAETETFFSSMTAFYQENSYGVFVPAFTVSTNTYRLSSLQTYGADCNGNVACNDNKPLFQAAIAAATTDNDFTAFDQVMIYHAGFGQETSEVKEDIWSVYIPQNDAWTIADGKTFPGFTVVPESEDNGYEPLGVICHEYGHQLGLVDIYDVSTGKSTVGSYSLMDYPYTGPTSSNPNGSNPPHLGAWDKKFLGFITPQSQTGTISLSAAEKITSATAYQQIPVAGASSNEYFLAEYRLRTAATYDRGIPMDGLAIWHIDDNIALNSTFLANNTVNAPSLSGQGHRGIDLVEADGTAADPNNGDRGNGNLFVDGQNFTSPQSNSFGGIQSGVTVSNIIGVGASAITANVLFIQSAPSLSIAKVVNYPNPAGDTSKYPVRAGAPAGTVTTILLELSQPVSTDRISLDVYTVGGERVLSVSGSAIALRLGSGQPTTDNKWVYEYDWNGKNDSGNAVASGVYFYRFKVNDKIETGKLVLVR